MEPRGYTDQHSSSTREIDGVKLLVEGLLPFYKSVHDNLGTYNVKCRPTLYVTYLVAKKSAQSAQNIELTWYISSSFCVPARYDRINHWIFPTPFNRK